MCDDGYPVGLRQIWQQYKKTKDLHNLKCSPSTPALEHYAGVLGEHIKLWSS